MRSMRLLRTVGLLLVGMAGGVSLMAQDSLSVQVLRLLERTNTWTTPQTLSGTTARVELFRGITGRGLYAAARGTTNVGLMQADYQSYYGPALFGVGNNAYSLWLESFKSRTTDGTTASIVQVGDELGRINFYGDDGVDILNYAGTITATVDATPGVNDIPMALEFYLSNGANAGQLIAAVKRAGFEISNGKAIQTTTTTGHTLLLRAYDVDNTTYRTFGTFTNGNTPDVTLAAPSGGTMTVQPSTYKSSDGTTGVTVTTCTSFKNGLCVAGT